jgi:putative aminopeptidase FrvX
LKVAEDAHKTRPKATLHLVGSVQEEFNLRGAMVAAAKLRPDLAVSIDLMVSGDTPDLEDRCELALGMGPVIGMYSFHGRGTLNGTIPHPALYRHFRDVARRDHIPFQRSANVGSLTDSSYVQLVDSGIPCIDLGYPARYTHTPVETCDISDLERLVTLIGSGLASMGSDFDLSRHWLNGT